MIFPMLTEWEGMLPVYLTGIGVQNSQEDIYRPEGFPDYQWFYVSRGKGTLIIDNKTYEIGPGQSFFLNKKHHHRYQAIDSPWTTHWVTFNGMDADRLFDLFDLGVGKPLIVENGLEIFKTIQQIITSGNIDRIKESSPFLYQLIFAIDNGLKKPITGAKEPSKLEPVIAYMTEHYMEDIGLDTLSELIDITPHYLCRLFKAKFGLSPIKYLIRLRLQVAKELLIKQPSMKVYAVARAVSYEDASYFCTIFKQQEKITPESFRKLHGV